MGIIKTLIVDPKKFITPPYWECPKCGTENSFGVLTINEQSYVRRCKECWFDKSYALPKLCKKVIYIDQFALSNMMKFLNSSTKAHKKGNLDNFWGELFSKLDRLCKLQLIICPDSTYHEDESLVSKFYEPLKSIYEMISRGVSFISGTDIKMLQIKEYSKIWATENGEIEFEIDKVTTGKIDKWLPRYIISLNHEISQKIVNEIRVVRAQTYVEMKEVFARWQNEARKSFEDWFSEESSQIGPIYYDKALNYYESVIEAKKKISKGLVIDTEKLIPTFAILLLQEVKTSLQEAGIDEKELGGKAYEFFHSSIWREIPFVRIMSMLFASIARKAAKGGQKNPPDRGTMFDFRLISEFLPYCDAMFIDKRSHAFLKESPLNKEIKKYGTEVFSLNNKEEFMKYLNQIENDASPEHMIKAKEVYGEENLKPYTTMYEKS